MAATAREGRRGGREARRQARTAITIRALPVLERAIPVYEVLNQEGLERIHEASLQILEQIGIDFRDAEAAQMWRDAGAEVERFRVRIPRQLLMGLVAKNPSRFTVHARNPERSTEIGGNKVAFAPTYGSPFVYDFDNQRRYGTLADLNQFHKLAYMAPAMHNTGAVICEPVDIPIPKRHLHITYSAIKHSDKPFMGPVTAPERAADAVRMARILFGDAFVDEHTVIMALVNCNSPLVWDETMLGALKVYARANQSVIISPFVLAGANTPASAVGSVAQLNAEALAGIAFAQLCRPGAPMVYGHFLAAVSMRSGAPMAGTPEIAFMNLMIGQLARKYRLPLRSSGMIAGSKRVDAQAAYESIQTMWAVFLSGANFIMHCAGWNEAGLGASFAKFVLDCEQIEMFYQLGQGPAVRRLRGGARGGPRDRPGRPLPRHGAHARALPERLLHARAARQQQLRAVGARRRQGRQHPRPRGRPPPARQLRAPCPRPGDRRSPPGLHPRTRSGPAGQHDVGS